MFKRLKIKKGDMVVVTAGNHKGEKGLVIAVHRDNDRVTVEGVNMISRHRKPSAQNPQGGIAFSPFVEYAQEFETGFKIDPKDVLMVSTPVTELENQYNHVFGSGIQIASSLPKL